MLQRTLSPGDVIRVDGPCDILIKMRRGQLTAHFDAPHKTRVSHRKGKTRVDKQKRRRSN
jgi:hypothetical protein